MREGQRDPRRPGQVAGDSGNSYRSRMCTLVPVLLCVATLAWLVLLFGAWGIDDPYITYRYADNLRSGKSFVYNVGERTLSTTAPLYALLLGAVGLVWHDLPRASNLISLLSVVGAGLVLMRWGPPGAEGAGLIAGLLLSVWTLVLTTTGLETALLVFLVLAGFLSVERSRPSMAAVMLALAGMLRPEGLLAGAVAGAAILMRRRRLPWHAVLLYLVPVAAFYAAIWLSFGSPVPVTLAAKQQQARLPGGVQFADGFLRLLRQYARNRLYWPHGALALVGVVRVPLRARHWGPLLVWTSLYFLGYSLLGVSPYFWYYASLVPALLVLVAEGAVAVPRALVGLRIARPVVGVLAGVLVACLLAPPLAGTAATIWRPDPRLDAYKSAGLWLRSESPPTATVGALEVGIIGYHAQRTMIDFSGLIRPEIARQLAAAGSYEESSRRAIDHFAPDYVVIDRMAFPALVAEDTFRSTYTPVHNVAGLGSLWLTIYERTGLP